MAKRKFKVKASGIEYTDTLRAYLEKKLKMLERLLPKTAPDIIFEVGLGKSTKHHKSGKIYRAEINLSYGAVMHRAEADAETIEIAIDEMKKELKAEISKRRGKREEKARNGGRILKKMIKGE